MNVICRRVAVDVAVKVEVILGVDDSVAVRLDVGEDSKVAVTVNEAVGLKNIWANASLVCTCAVLIVAVGEMVTSKRSSGWMSLRLPPDTSIGIPKLMLATIKMAKNKTMFLAFILQAFPVFLSAKVLQGLYC